MGVCGTLASDDTILFGMSKWYLSGTHWPKYLVWCPIGRCHGHYLCHITLFGVILQMSVCATLASVDTTLLGMSKLYLSVAHW